MGTWQVFRGGCLGEPTAVMCTPPLNRHLCLGVGLAGQHAIGRVHTLSPTTPARSTAIRHTDPVRLPVQRASFSSRI